MSRRFRHFPPEEPDPRSLEQRESFAAGFEFFDLEHSELDRRLRSMDWPTAPAQVKERCLKAVLQQAALGFPSLQADEAELPARNGLRVVSERVERHELSRRRLDILSDRVNREDLARRRLDVLSERTLRAPRREPRYATVL